MVCYSASRMGFGLRELPTASAGYCFEFFDSYASLITQGDRNLDRMEALASACEKLVNTWTVNKTKDDAQYSYTF